jgi:hypothetical protein
MIAGAPAFPWRRFVAPWALGTAGVASLLLVPPAAPVVASAPAWVATSPLGLHLLPALGRWR